MSLVFHRELQNIYCIFHNHRHLYCIGNFTDGTTGGINPSVYFQHEFFFWRAFCVVGILHQIFFTNRIIDERYADRRIPLVI
jgi:hypothetical protein